MKNVKRYILERCGWITGSNVTVGTRKLKTKWSIAAEQDLKGMYDI